jgi:hypothetical protein
MLATTGRKSLAARYMELQNEMNLLHDNEMLKDSTAALLDVLPVDGPVALFSTSDQGAGLVAAAAVLRDAPTTWQRIHLTYAPSVPPAHRLFVVESVDAGVAWRHAIERLYPDAQIVIVGTRQPAALAA